MSLSVSVTPASPPISVVIGGQAPILATQAASQSLSFAAGSSTLLSGDPPPKPREMVAMQSIKSSGSVSISALTTSGYFTVRWWDGSLTIAGPYNGTTPMVASKAVPATGNWSGSSPKTIYAWSGNRTQSGRLTLLGCASAGLFDVDASGCESLASLDVSINVLPRLSVESCPSLASLYCQANELTSLKTSGAGGLLELYCHSNRLTSLNLQANPLVQSLQCNDNLLTSLSPTASLVSLYCHNNQLRALDLRGSLGIKNLNCSGNQITSIRATGLAINGPVGASLTQNLLSAASLDAFYQDLAATTGGSIYVAGNPGTAGDTPSIAAAKGYIVYGT
jgi:hypothetical protein